MNEGIGEGGGVNDPQTLRMLREWDERRTTFRAKQEEFTFLIFLWLWLMAFIHVGAFLVAIVFSGSWIAFAAFAFIWPYFFWGCKQAQS